MLVLINGLQAGNLSGTGRYTMELVRRLPALTEDFDFAVLWPQELPLPQEDDLQRMVFLRQDTGNPLKRFYLDQMGIRRAQTRLMANIVHYTASVGNLISLHNPVLTVHDLSFCRHPEWFRLGRAAYYRFAVAASVRQAKRVVADSRATARDLTEFLGVAEDRIDVIPLGVDDAFQAAPLEAKAAARAKYHLPEAFFLYVGTLEPRKNLVRLINAWSRVAGECPQSLVIAGRSGWKVGPIRKAAASSALSERIHFCGFVAPEDLPAVISCADAFVWPSLWEGFGLPPLEAMACGVPVLTSNTSSIPEAVGDAALLVDPWDVDAIADGLTQIGLNTGLRERLVTAGPVQARQYTWRRTAEATLDTYRAVLGG